MSLELKHKRARLYSHYVEDAIRNAVENNYSGRLLIGFNFFEGGITECKVQTHKEELITVDKLKPNS